LKAALETLGNSFCQIEGKALRKLKHPSRSRELRTFWITERQLWTPTLIVIAGLDPAIRAEQRRAGLIRETSAWTTGSIPVVTSRMQRPPRPERLTAPRLLQIHWTKISKAPR
jgi:hypothetical protein